MARFLPCYPSAYDNEASLGVGAFLLVLFFARCSLLFSGPMTCDLSQCAQSLFHGLRRLACSLFVMLMCTFGILKIPAP